MIRALSVESIMKVILKKLQLKIEKKMLEKFVRIPMTAFEAHFFGACIFQ